MPLFARWRKLSALPPRRGRDAQPGVYELADENKTLIYIGQSAKDVPNRIRQHLQKSACIKERVVYWRYSYSRMPRAEEAKQIRRYALQHGDLPICNCATPLPRDVARRYRERSGSS